MLTGFRDSGYSTRNALAVQWLEPGVFTAEVWVQLLVRETKIPQDVWCGQKRKKKEIWHQLHPEV